MRIWDVSPLPLPPPPPPLTLQKQLWKKEKKWEIGLEGRKELALYVLLEESLDLLKVTIFPWLMVGIFDLRQRQLRHTFLAHDAPVKSIVVDENEEFFISGSEDGDIKVTTNCTSKSGYWNVHLLLRFKHVLKALPCPCTAFCQAFSVSSLR